MPPPIVIEEEIQANRKRRKHNKDYIKLCLRTNNCEPNDADVKAYSDLQNGSDMEEHDLMDAKVERTLFVLNMVAAINAS